MLVNTQEKPKLIYIYFVINTCDINHTALATDTIKKYNINLDTFNRLYYTTPTKFGPKDRTSREHDEIVSKCANAFGLTVKYIETRTRKDVIRHAIIYKRIRSDKYDDVKEIHKTLEYFIKHFHRYPNDNTKKCTVTESMLLPQ